MKTAETRKNTGATKEPARGPNAAAAGRLAEEHRYDAAKTAPPTDATQREAALHERLALFPAALFDFDNRMKDGWLADRYFIRTAETLAYASRDPIVRMQVFAKKSGVLAGVYEFLRMLETQLAQHPVTGRKYELNDFTIDTMMDGDKIEGWESVMHIQGPYLAFAHLETTGLGVLARRTLVATNVRKVIEAADKKPVIFMAARHDDWRVQAADGYAAMIGGAGSVSSHAGGSWWGAEGIGTMPHALIAAFNGDVVAATVAFTRYIRDNEPGVKVISLTDYNNNVIEDSLAVARRMKETFGEKALFAVRVDTSEKLEDKGIVNEPDSAFLPGESRTGVNSVLVKRLREAFDREGFNNVKIYVSGGFVPAKMRRFKDANVPVDGFGVGSSNLGHNRGEEDGLATGFDFTADIVTVDGRAESKIGREKKDNARFVRFKVSSLREAEEKWARDDGKQAF